MKRLLPLLLLAALLTPPGVSVAGAEPASPSARAADPDPRWVFYTKDKHRYSSPWYAGKHRKMVPYGCTRAPYYDPDPRCRRNRGFHHGIDIAMPCGTKLYAARKGRVVSNDALGPAYGVNPLLFRNYKLDVDFLLAHTRRVFVQPGERVRNHHLIATASDRVAPLRFDLHLS